MIDYRFYKLYKEYVYLESSGLMHHPDLKQVSDENEDGIIDQSDLVSSEDTKKELSNLSRKVQDAVDSFDSMSNSSNTDKKKFMDKLYKIAINVFNLLKKKRKNMQEEFIFKDLFNKIYDISQINVDKEEDVIEVRKNITFLLKDIDYHLNKFHRSFFTGTYSYN